MLWHEVTSAVADRNFMQTGTTHEKTALSELLGAALNTLEEGVAVLDEESRVVAWNPAAAAISGYRSADLLARELPDDFYALDTHPPGNGMQVDELVLGGLVQVKLLHGQGHLLPVMLRQSPLRDALGRRFGTLLRFHPAEEVDALPHGTVKNDSDFDKHVEQSQAEMAARLNEAWQEWVTGEVPFGVLWITVDQATVLRKTHGHDASEAMLAIVERTLVHALRPTEILGQWGTNEFLVLCHERTPEMLLQHARHVRELAQGADFRWWGDRVPLTVSIGMAQAKSEGKLAGLLCQAQRSMQAAMQAGGNQVVLEGVGSGITGDGVRECSQS